MSNYTSQNTTILATHVAAGDNKRMLLLHVYESGRHEYVIGSYFTVEANAFVDHYSWDWGHYFGDVVSAVDYWKNEVLRATCYEPFSEKLVASQIAAEIGGETAILDKLRNDGTLDDVLYHAKQYFDDEIYGESDVMRQAVFYGIKEATGFELEEYAKLVSE